MKCDKCKSEIPNNDRIYPCSIGFICKWCADSVGWRESSPRSAPDGAVTTTTIDDVLKGRTE